MKRNIQMIPKIDLRHQISVSLVFLSGSLPWRGRGEGGSLHSGREGVNFDVEGICEKYLSQAQATR